MSERSEKLAEAASAAKLRVDAKLGHVWWAILLRGLLALALAACAFLWPSKTVGIFVKLLGAYFAVDGVIAAVAAYRGDRKTSTIAQAIVSLSLGLVLLFWTGLSAKLFLVLVGVWLLLQGVSLVLAAFQMDQLDETRGLTFTIGGVMAVIGLVFVVWTDAGVVAISWLIGAGALIVGCLLVYLATRVQRLRKNLHGHVNESG